MNSINWDSTAIAILVFNEAQPRRHRCENCNKVYICKACTKGMFNNLKQKSNTNANLVVKQCKLYFECEKCKRK